VSCEVEEDVPDAVLGDENRIREVLLNLLSNALKFTEKGEIVTEVSCTGRAGPDHAVLRFAVTDTGIGIPENRLDELFESFTQLESSADRRYGGTGLGTTIARDLVQLMGGKLEVSSEPGQGTTFWFELELELCALPDSLDGPRDIGVRWPGIRILVGEDDPISARVVQSFLSAFDCEIDIAQDGSEVLSRLGSNDYDLLFMDMRMPVTDGITAARQWRATESKQSKNNSGSRLPIIALTANATLQDQKACLSAGMDGFLTKPVEPEALARVLEDWLGPGSAQ
jgi:CheY-like chemotaxis protein